MIDAQPVVWSICLASCCNKSIPCVYMYMSCFLHARICPFMEDRMYSRACTPDGGIGGLLVIRRRWKVSGCFGRTGCTVEVTLDLGVDP
jgi:hypothetical protein